MILHLLDAISRAPSRYNEQPVRVRREEDGITLLLDEGSPHAQMSLGAALEIALVTLEGHGMSGWYEQRPGPSVYLRWTDGDVTISPAEALATYRAIPLRRTSRLPYFPDLPDVPSVKGVRLVEDHQALLRSIRPDPDWRKWLRVSPADPRWHRDGLTADCLAMRRWEARLLSWFPWHWLDDPLPPCPAMGEVVPSGDLVEDGRRLMRFWLLATRVGLSLHPLWHEGRVVFRLGVSPPVPRSPRRPVDELLDLTPRPALRNG